MILTNGANWNIYPHNLGRISSQKKTANKPRLWLLLIHFTILQSCWSSPTQIWRLIDHLTPTAIFASKMGLHTKHWFMPVRKSSAFKQQTTLWNGHVVAFCHVHTYTFLSHLRFTLKETNGFAPRNGWRWNTTLILGRPIFSGELLVLRKGTILKRRETQPENQPVPVKIARFFSGILRVPFGQHHFLMWFFHKNKTILIGGFNPSEKY